MPRHLTTRRLLWSVLVALIPCAVWGCAGQGASLGPAPDAGGSSSAGSNAGGPSGKAGNGGGGSGGLGGGVGGRNGTAGSVGVSGTGGTALTAGTGGGAPGSGGTGGAAGGLAGTTGARSDGGVGTVGAGGRDGSAGSSGGSGGGGSGGSAGQDPTTHLDDLKRSFLQMQFGLWHHFGILTYTGTWAEANLPINDFNPGTTLNPQQWAAAAKSAGAKFGVLTTRHHDGFALWPSNASSFNVGHTTWYAQVGGQAAPNDKGDVVQQFVNGYRAEGLQPAFYYSIWDTTHPVSGTLTPEMVQYLTTQLTELMSNYGKIPLLIIDGWSWMMGHHAAEGWYLHNLIKSLQPDILIVDHEGLESPYDEDLVMYEEPRGVFAPAGNTWAATQGQKINQHGGNDWFWKSNITGYLSVSDIVDSHINLLVPRYTNFILNCPPNNQGLLDDAVVTELAQVGTYRQAHPAAVPAQLPTQGVQNSNPYFPVSASASSGTAGNAIDGSNDIGRYSIWQSSGSLPQWIQIDLGSVKSTGFLGYLPPYQAGSAWNSSTGNCSGTPCAVPAATGLITSYEIDVSTDGTTFTKVTTGSWRANGKLQGASFGPMPARYVRLIALAVNSGTSAQATELEVGGPQTLTLVTPKVTDWGH
jgi:alpha-L-fucosidase